jgi:predicted MFS family arabinose efflux permease
MLLAFAALPLRAALFAITDEPALIMGLQVLDAVGGGLFEALLPLVLADVVRGTGRYNVSRGVLGTIQGIGGASSHAFGGYLAAEAGYGAAFLSLAGVGVVAFVLVLLAMPETRPAEEAGEVRG